MMRRLLDAQWAGARGADAIIYHPKALGGVHIAERLGIPAFIALTIPCLTPTRAFPNPMLPFANLGPLNAASHKFFIRYANSLFREPINRWRREVLKLASSRRDESLNGTPVPRLYGYSSAVVPRPLDWDQSSHVTGYWFLNAIDDWQPDPALQRFLEAGPPPVYVGFGSIPAADPRRMTTMIVEALALVGQRGLLASGWGGLSATVKAEHVFILESAPHDRLFPHVSAVVHHGGAGTTAAGLRAGKPTVICPFFGDQPFWGRRVAALGVGPPPIARKHLTSSTLAEAVGLAVKDESLRDRAASLGAIIRTEDGVKAAVGLLKGYLDAVTEGTRKGMSTICALRE
jgi:UDP:flavonoid glycosyltransferase YjiC (YdhE family)